MSDRIRNAFAKARRRGRAARIFYMPGGFPDRAASDALLDILADEGADILELGMPFSDPIADGPVIQAAGQRALAAGATLRSVLDQGRRLRERYPELGLVLFSYANPIYSYGPEALCRDAAAAGFDALLLTDVPHEEEAEFRRPAEAAGLDWIPLVSPATDPDRAALLTAGCTGFVYVITVRGITGERTGLPAGLGERLAALRRVTGLPLAAGFGIADRAAADAVAEHADGYIVGSAAVRAADAGPDALRAFLRGFR